MFSNTRGRGDLKENLDEPALVVYQDVLLLRENETKVLPGTKWLLRSGGYLSDEVKKIKAEKNERQVIFATWPRHDGITHMRPSTETRTLIYVSLFARGSARSQWKAIFRMRTGVFANLAKLS